MSSPYPNSGIIYYTENRLAEPLFSLVQQHIAAAGLPIVSCSLAPLDFGRNIVLDAPRGYIAMNRQILTALEHAREEVVFFCEHDVLYHPSHFTFRPERDDIFYYNENVWRWQIGTCTAVTYNRMLPLSCLCCARALALRYFRLRLAMIYQAGVERFETGEPELGRRWGYEPGTKPRRRGGLTDDVFETWRSAGPNLDVRHRGTFSPPKIRLDSFRHRPTGWREVPVEETGWGEICTALNSAS